MLSVQPLDSFAVPPFSGRQQRDRPPLPSLRQVVFLVCTLAGMSRVPVFTFAERLRETCEAAASFSEMDPVV